MKATGVWIVVVFIVTQIVALDISQTGAASNTSLDSTPSIVNGTVSKDFRLQCDSSSMGLVRSEQRPIIYYLRGVCAGAYGDMHKSRCSFLDLGMCYANDQGRIRPQRMGGFDGSCWDCTYYMSHGSGVLDCTCAQGDAKGGGTRRATYQLESLVYVKNGFLSCYGYTSFECPSQNENIPF